MRQEIAHVTLVVRDYDEAIDFYCNTLGFDLVEYTYQPEQDKRWVVVKPKGANGCSLVLGKASTPRQEAFIGNQSGGRVFLFLATDDFQRDYAVLLEKGVEFARDPASTMERLPCSRIFTVISGTWWSSPKATRPGSRGCERPSS